MRQVRHLAVVLLTVGLCGTVMAGDSDSDFGPFPPSGKPVEIPFSGLLRLEDGKIAELWVEWDNLNALVQLGHFVPPGGETPE